MKKLLLLLFLFLFPILSSFAQVKQINIFGRPIGVGTRVDVPATVANTCTANGIQIDVKRVQNSLMPQDFYLGMNFYQGKSWGYPQPYYNGMDFRFAAVGNKVELNAGELLGTFKVYVDQNLSGTTLFSTEIRVFDEETDWSVGFGEFKVINLSFERYGNYNNDGKKDIRDGTELWKYVGLIPSNDTLLVAFDLDGNGEINDYDEYLFLDNLVNKVPFPIHTNSTTVIAGNIVPINVIWTKMPDGRWGLSAKESITNGNIYSRKNLSLPDGSNLMFKKVNDKNYFYGAKIFAGKQILVSDYPDYSITGKFNNNRPIKVVTAITDVKDNETIPNNFSLKQNYPNPFNPSTVISYQVPTDGTVMLKIYNITGEEVRTLVNENKPAGKYEVIFDASGLPSGVYLYKISTGNFVQVKKMLLMK